MQVLGAGATGRVREGAYLCLIPRELCKNLEPSPLPELHRRPLEDVRTQFCSLTSLLTDEAYLDHVGLGFTALLSSLAHAVSGTDGCYGGFSRREH